jgi:phage shock protein C
MVNKRIYRSRTDKVLGGICGGIGAYLEIDPVLIRIIAVVLLFTWGTGVLIYIIAWILIPLEPEEENITARLIS